MDIFWLNFYIKLPIASEWFLKLSFMSTVIVEYCNHPFRKVRAFSQLLLAITNIFFWMIKNAHLILSYNVMTFCNVLLSFMNSKSMSYSKFIKISVLDQRPKFYGRSRRFQTYGYGGRSLRPNLRPKVLIVVKLSTKWWTAVFN